MTDCYIWKREHALRASTEAERDTLAQLGERLAEALRALDPANKAFRTDCNERKCGACSTCAARDALSAWTKALPSGDIRRLSPPEEQARRDVESPFVKDGRWLRIEDHPPTWYEVSVEVAAACTKLERRTRRAEADVARLREALEDIAGPSVLSNKTQIIDAHRQIAKEVLTATERRKDGEGNG